MKIIFWASIIVILYTYIGYPLLIYFLSSFYKKPVRGKYIYPTVSLLVAAYNEEARIENKIKTLLELDYPDERIEILIGSDGSTDKTEEIISKYTNDKIKLFRLPQRQGKPSVLNMLVPQAKGELLVFTDARQTLDKNALKELVKNFCDPKVGSASGELFYINEDDNKPGAGLGLYWSYEKFIRKSESRMGSMLGATGAFYAIRKELFMPLPEDLILDDVYTPMKIVSKGYRAIFDAKAKVFDKVFNETKDEFLRKSRTLAGNFQLFVYLRELFNPLKGKISWQFFSHKFLRLMVPFLLMIVFVSNVGVVVSLKIGTVPFGDSPYFSYFYWIFLWLQVAFYACAFLGMVFKHRNRVLDIPYMFCVMNSAAVVGLHRFLTRKEHALWEKAV